MRYKLSISVKLFASYFLVILLSLFIGAYAIIQLNTLNKVSSKVMNTGIPLIYTSEKMLESFTNQNNFGKRYFILKNETGPLPFFSGEEEFKKYLGEIQGNSVDEDIDLIRKVYDQYLALFSRAVSEKESNNPQWITDEKQLSSRGDMLVRLIQNLKNNLLGAEKERVVFINSINQQSLYTLMVLCGASLFLGLGFSFLVTSYFTKTIHKIKQTTQLISKGKYDGFPMFLTGDEMGDLDQSFKSMAERLKELEALHLDANPLSRLPGNLAIEREIIKRIQSQSPMAFCLIDLDNFKAYGDTYGYARGSEILTIVAGILVKMVQTVGRKDDFIGHIGGDDFVLITETSRVHLLCQKFISEFDQTIPHYYDDADRRRGYIVAKDRKDVEQNFPLMTVSIAVVTNEKRKFQSVEKIAELAAQLKHYAKTFPKSIYVIDQRRT
ncbi:MAG: diguanylate cyclase [Nitrospiria bacterium]